MNVLIFVNRAKDTDRKNLDSLKSSLEKRNIKYETLFAGENDSCSLTDVSALFVIGGDGTLLRRTEFANLNGIPLIGINAGKLGFLNEFETAEIETAVSLLSQNKLVRENRATIKAEFNGKTFYALNDIVIQRTYIDAHGSVLTLNLLIDGKKVSTLRGDGIIVATPTGSTAYSLSAGGAILAPGIDAFIMTPISAHSFTQRPIIFSSNSIAEVQFVCSTSAGLIVDGCFSETLSNGDVVKIGKAEAPTVFLRRDSYDFYDRLTRKLKERTDAIL